MALDQSKQIDYDDEEEENSGEAEMTFLEHLEELRWHLIRSVGAILVFMIIAWFAMGSIFNKIILGPAKIDFWTYRKLCDLVTWAGFDQSNCVQEMNFTLMSREVSGQFMMQLKMSAIIGLLVAFPYVFWEVWRFVKPGLKMKEKKASRGSVFFVTLLFSLGVLFGYYIVSPLALNFLVNFQIDPQIKNDFDIQSYISTLSTLTLACGVAFQLPMAMFVLTQVGVIGPEFLRLYRRHAIVVLLIIAALITPSPDMISQILVAIPLYLLYEISILVSQRVERRIKKAEAKA